jgi:hypothetical protein
MEVIFSSETLIVTGLLGVKSQKVADARGCGRFVKRT